MVHKDVVEVKTDAERHCDDAARRDCVGGSRGGAVRHRRNGDGAGGRVMVQQDRDREGVRRDGEGRRMTP